MEHARLDGLNLYGADLREASLINFTDNDKTKWAGVIYSHTTNFSGTQFEGVANREKEGMIYEYYKQE